MPGQPVADNVCGKNEYKKTHREQKVGKPAEKNLVKYITRGRKNQRGCRDTKGKKR
jgi:hypothetical protein